MPQLLKDTLVTPLRDSFARELVAVKYGCLESDLPADLANGTSYFGGEVLLEFAGARPVYLSWISDLGWPDAYALSARHGSFFREGVLQLVTASALPPWRKAIGEPLVGLEVLGWRGIPNVVKLDFAGAGIVVATGHTHLIGPGDEILVRPATVLESLKSIESQWREGLEDLAGR